MRFRKDGKVYGNIDALLHEACPKGVTGCYRKNCAIRDKALEKQDSCYTYATEHQEETARYFGFEVIDYGPTIGEIVEKYGEDANPKRRTLGVSNPTDDMAEYAKKYLEAVKPRKLTRADILHAAEKCVCGQREQDYGTPKDNFETIAELWETYLSRACVDEAGGVYIDANDVAMMMALLKIARIAAGGGKADSWIDLAGYAACGAECEGVME